MKQITGLDYKIKEMAARIRELREIEGLSVADMAQKTAVSEAVTNCIVHAYRNEVGDIELSAKAFPDGLIYIKIKDHGCGIEDVKKAMEPLFTTLADEERSGLGFSVMESFCDSVKVRSRPGCGTTVTLTKRLRTRIE